MRNKTEKFWIKKLLNYAAKIDIIWLVIWGTIFASFVVLDSIFQTAYPGKDVFWEFSLGSRPVMIQVVGNGTFIGVTVLKYIGIVLSFLYARRKFPKDHILQIALAFTLLADTILTLDNVSVFGVLAFCVAQYFHIARFAKTKPQFFAGYSLTMVLFLMFGYFNHIPEMYILALVYASCLICNIILTYRWWQDIKKDHENRTDREVVASTCAFYGFVLFLMCDTNVALSYLSVTGVLPLFLARYVNFFAWLFYYPSQVLISNSSVITKKSIKSKKKVVTGE
jgi:hypothetical protein